MTHPERIDHDGPGHRVGDPGYCGGCWWELIGQAAARTAARTAALNHLRTAVDLLTQARLWDDRDAVLACAYALEARRNE